MPSTSDATQNPLLVPAASSVVPSMVKGMPQDLQLLAPMGERDWQRGHMMNCLPSSERRIARRPLAGGGVGVDRMRVLLDDFAGHRIDEPAVAVEDGDDNRVAAGRALAFLAGHVFGGFEARGAVAAVEAEAPAGGGGTGGCADDAARSSHGRRCGGRRTSPMPAATVSRRGAGMRSVVRHLGQRTNCPACASSADSEVRQTWHSNTIIAMRMVFPPGRFRDIRSSEMSSENREIRVQRSRGV